MVKYHINIHQEFKRVGVEATSSLYATTHTQPPISRTRHSPITVINIINPRIIDVAAVTMMPPMSAPPSTPLPLITLSLSPMDALVAPVANIDPLASHSADEFHAVVPLELWKMVVD